MTDSSAAKNKKTLTIVFGVVGGMLILSFASVPLYRKICQVTGWGGTTQEVTANPFKDKTFSRHFTVRFNADTDSGLNWIFKPDLISTEIKVGQDGFATFTAQNKDINPVTGTAVYNVTPLQAGKYFYKTQCFCFGEQTLQSGQTVHMPVTFFIDPKIMDDRDLRDLKTITLSYAFYKKDTPALEKAVENFMDKPDNPNRKN